MLFTHFILIETIKYNKPKAHVHFRFCIIYQGVTKSLFFLFVTILAQAFFTLVCGHFMSFSLLTAWHNNIFLKMEITSRCF